MTPAPATPETYYTGHAFAIETRTNVRTVKCLHCRQPIAPRQGRSYTTISVRYHGYLCPTCQDAAISFDQLYAVRSAKLNQIHTFLRERDPLMYWETSDYIGTLVYRANLACVEVAQWFLDRLAALEMVNYHTVRELIREYKAQGEPQ